MMLQCASNKVLLRTITLNAMNPLVGDNCGVIYTNMRSKVSVGARGWRGVMGNIGG